MTPPAASETFETRVRQQIVTGGTVTYALVPKVVADRMRLKGGQVIVVTIDTKGAA